ncbi:hypothetical protein L2E82_47110 [Cichorium intybus]|uniref:Uncharacterized protein n=1 Tax=Cichorium intybus TaxID=13427 RepID=A0ACB8YVQ6_CICIN|nr:hypothetical protein L2E82_47110 [Cichorium intybus]
MNRLHHGLRTKCHDVLHVYFLKHRITTFLLVLFVVSIPWLGSGVWRDFMVHNLVELRNDNSNEHEIFEVLIRNLTNEGMLGEEDRGLIVNNDYKNEKLVNHYPSHILHNNKMDMIPWSDLESKQSSIEYKYDFAFMHEGVEELIIDKVLKVDGIMVVRKKEDLRASESFQKPSNYEIIYQKQFEPRFDVTIIAMKKTRMIDDKNDASNTNPHRRLMFAQKKAEALKNLENVFLEPPRTLSGKSNTYSKKTRYLPDLMHDSLEDYPRRVFIDVNGDGGWFTKNYPTRNMNFEIYQIETTMPEITDTDTNEVMDELVEIEISDWLWENVKNDEYVVMKAEADVVEQLVNNKAIELVDELFLECKYQCMKCKKCKRPYWKCLALYGLLKDVGVAVHQWWG